MARSLPSVRALMMEGRKADSGERESETREPTQLDAAPLAAPLDAAQVYTEHADYVWRSLFRLGVAEPNLPDLMQEVFVVVHRRRRSFDPERSLRAWLFGICVGLVRNHRRRSARDGRRGVAVQASPVPGPEEALEKHRQRSRGRVLLDALGAEKRAVFVMYEVEGWSCRAIAESLGVPLGTVHSRLHAARRELAAGLTLDPDATLPKGDA
ncbi:MAG: RNA polymerase sigma factor [Sandaracinaceae bacterium]